MTEDSPQSEDTAFFVYLLRCEDDSLYTGIAANVFDRVAVHNVGKGAKYTRSRRPVRLVYHERCESRSQALQREAEIKKWTRACKESLIQNQAR